MTPAYTFNVSDEDTPKTATIGSPLPPLELSGAASSSNDAPVGAPEPSGEDDGADLMPDMLGLTEDDAESNVGDIT